MKIVEIFGPTIQGEGPLIGKRCVFVRLAGCDSDCVWCDTRYAWDKQHPEFRVEDLSIDCVYETIQMRDPKTRNIILTGGNPALHPDVEGLMIEFDERDPNHKVKFHVETQGTMFQPWFHACDWVVISPKLSNAKLTTPITPLRVESNILQCDPSWVKVSLKFVVFTPQDLEEVVSNWVCLFGAAQDVTIQVGTLPTDHDSDILNRWHLITTEVMKTPELSDVRILPQAHVLLWGHKKGV